MEARMNDRYFVCRTCKTYTDAGYRWARYQLEDPGIVQADQPVDVVAVLRTSSYWNPPEGHERDWNCDEILPRVHQFLAQHGGHDLVYVTRDWDFDSDGPCSDWVEWRGDSPIER
jgi:hypothetical protein